MIAIVIRVSVGIEIIMIKLIISYGIGYKNYARFKIYKKYITAQVNMALLKKGLVNLKPGDSGSDVLEIQRKIKEKGYYPGNLDGIYGEGMKQYVIKFRKDNSIKECHDINKEFYEKLGIALVD
ncbi:peptidoglycan-binding domain-containing protein [Clostridium beijerinckii]|uniref:Peptidoglycan binding-like domain-containing protein n=2 Tax=Clostridium beijerinckii TaxID=1520 RepID=A0A9Q5CKZ2_CLOBE|nr:peptidoglycan-binding domain-containing protein [Clostridium beijerinckii]MBA2885329.1 hypothetical protein [Clostridium beijerinckii]MBA2900170.1 hypothetical protein [Clostridium beijerinckii]MBA2909799.1 hypothetical protein [Clostridium beijerinckii]NRT02872.1 hypothetical protein [Clostridium beijerinckii]NRT28909.1 hypothetical protein [Clostridium beijerinckii]